MEDLKLLSIGIPTPVSLDLLALPNKCESSSQDNKTNPNIQESNFTNQKVSESNADLSSSASATKRDSEPNQQDNKDEACDSATEHSASIGSKCKSSQEETVYSKSIESANRYAAEASLTESMDSRDDPSTEFDERLSSDTDSMNEEVFEPRLFKACRMHHMPADYSLQKKHSLSRFMREAHRRNEAGTLPKRSCGYKKILRKARRQHVIFASLIAKIHRRRSRCIHRSLRKYRPYLQPVIPNLENENLESSSEEEPGVEERECDDSLKSKPKNRISPKFWTSEENRQLLLAVQKYGNQWGRVASMVKNRSSRQCKEHWTRVLSKRDEARGINAQIIAKHSKAREAEILLKQWRNYQKLFKNKDPQTPHESSDIPPPNTSQSEKDEREDNDDDETSFSNSDIEAPLLEQDTSLQRCVKGRGNSAIRIGYWMPEEDRALVAAHARLGSRWIQVATIIPGRTKRQCERRFRRLREKLKKQALHSGLASPIPLDH